MKVVLGFHFRGDNGLRDEIFKRLRPMVEGLYGFSASYDCDSGHTIYNRAASRNLVVRRALELEADVVVVCDADSIPERQPLERTIQSAFSDGGIWTPFDRVNQLSAFFIRRKTLRPEKLGAFHTYGPSFGGCYVARPSEWVRIGGMDERIEGWGYEDQIFLVAARTWALGHQFHSGTLYTFEHPRWVSAEKQAQNAYLRDRYNENCGNQEKIRELQAGSNHFRPN